MSSTQGLPKPLRIEHYDQAVEQIAEAPELSPPRPLLATESLLTEVPEPPSDSALPSEKEPILDARPVPVPTETLTFEQASAKAETPRVQLPETLPAVVRITPEGAPGMYDSHPTEIRITYSQPVIELGSIEDLSVPKLILEPEVEGSWQWDDPKQLVFQPEQPFPQATEFKLTLEDGKTHGFSTARPEPDTWYTGLRENDATLKPELFMKFNIPVVADSVLKHLTLTTAPPDQVDEVHEEILADRKRFLNNKTTPQEFPLEQIEPAESDDSKIVRFAPTEELPRDTICYLKLSPGVKAQEGPLTSTAGTWSAIRTYGPLKYIDTHAEPRYTYGIPQSVTSYLRFNNRLESFEEVVVDPPVLKARPQDCDEEGLFARQKSPAIMLDGTLSPGQYTITARGVKDIHGQALDEVTTTLKVAPGDPEVLAPTEQMVSLSPEEPHFLVRAFHTSHIRVDGYRANPETDWKRYKDYQMEYHESRGDFVPHKGKALLGKAASKLGVKNADAWSKTLPVESEETSIDLSEFLPESGVGHTILNIKPCKQDGSPTLDWTPISVWVQVTRMDLAAFPNGEELEVLVLDGPSGQPQKDLDLRLVDGENIVWATSDQDGWARLPREKEPDYRTHYALLAERADDTAFLPVDWPQQNLQACSQWSASPLEWDGSFTGMTVYAWTDRGLYRPGEEVAVKGWIRRRESYRAPLDLPKEMTLSYSLKSNSRNIVQGTGELSERGSFSLRVHLPKSAEYGDSLYGFGFGGGNCSINLLLGERYRYRVDFQVADFRPPEFEVQASYSHGSVIRGESLQAEAKASYFSGGVLESAPVQWKTVARTISYTPPGRHDFFFGPWSPRWWRWWSEDKEVSVESHSETGSVGKACVALEFLDGEPDQTLQVETTAVITDLNQQQWTDSCQALVHSSALCVGLRTKELLIAPGRPFQVELLVTDLNGQAVADQRVEVTYGKQTHKLQSALEPVQVEFRQEGSHLVEARVSDSEGRVSRSSLPLWTWGGVVSRPDTQEVVLILDKSTYSVGEKAELMALSPFPEATGVLRVGSGRVFHEQRFQVSGGEVRLEFPISEEMVPKSVLRVDLLNPQGLSHACGSLELEVPPTHHRLDVTVTPEVREAAPDTDIVVAVQVVNAEGEPVPQAEVALVVVDEAILYLAGYQIPAPLEALYHDQIFPLQQSLLHSHRILPSLEELIRQRANMEERNVLYCLGGGGSEQPPRSSGAFPRHRFAALAHFEPVVQTDAQGRAEISFRLPSNLTRYRVTAVVSAGLSQFGLGESSITTSQPLIVRPSPPRFLISGDRFQLPVLLQNSSSSPLPVKLAIRANGLELESPTGFELEIPAHGRREVAFTAKTQKVEEAVFTVVAHSLDFQDSVQLKVPVVEASLIETMASYGHLDSGVAALALRIPETVDRDRGGLELSLSTTALAHLEPALAYLYLYPYNCAEQRASRILGLVAAEPYLEAFDSSLPRGRKLRTVVEGQIQELVAQQSSYEGGWGFWPDSRIDAWVTVHAAHALVKAREAGFEIPSDSLKRAEKFLVEWELEEEMPGSREHQARAYALWVLDLMNIGVSWQDEARALSQEKDLPLEAWGWLLPLLKTDTKVTELGLRRLHNELSQTSSQAHFEGSAGFLSWILGSAFRQDAVLLSALMEVTPDDPVIVKLVNGLLAHRQGGRWGNTQENIFSVLALTHYFQKYEKMDPDLVARAWIGEQQVLEQSFLGRSKEQRSLHVPMTHLQSEQPDSVTLSHQGHGRLYYRTALSYAATEPAKSISHGFRVEREYLGDGQDVVLQDGAWKIRVGALIRVRLRVKAPRRHHVALVDRLPAGLEPLEPNRQPSATHAYGWDHCEFRDHEVRVFSREIQGQALVDYCVRATTKGTFLAPSCTVEEMYRPETFGRSGVETVVVW
jgi:alpha-2-macroglobulin